jgi:hypothetical protein
MLTVIQMDYPNYSILNQTRHFILNKRASNIQFGFNFLMDLYLKLVLNDISEYIYYRP